MVKKKSEYQLAKERLKQANKEYKKNIYKSASKKQKANERESKKLLGGWRMSDGENHKVEVSYIDVDKKDS